MFNCTKHLSDNKDVGCTGEEEEEEEEGRGAKRVKTYGTPSIAVRCCADFFSSFAKIKGWFSLATKAEAEEKGNVSFFFFFCFCRAVFTSA